MKFNIMQKLLFVVTLPIITLLIFSINFINTKYTQVTQNQRQLIYLNTIEKTSDLIHQLQIERGLSSIYLNKKSDDFFTTTLTAQKKKCDQSIKIFQKALLSLNPSLLSSSNIVYIQNIQNIFNELTNLRTLIQKKEIKSQKTFHYFTLFNDNLIALLNGLKIHTSSQSTNMDIITLNRIIQLQELAGQERAFVVSVAYSKHISYKKMQQFYNLRSSQKNEYAKITFLLKSTEFDGQLKDIHQKYKNNFYYQTIAKITAKIIEDDILSLDAKEWFRVSSERINTIHQLEDKLLKKISLSINDDITTANNSLLWQITLTLLTITLLLFSTFYVANKIKYAISQLENGIEDFFKFLNFQSEKAQDIATGSNDEINDMAQNINRNRLLIQENLDRDQDFINEITQIVMLMKDGDFSERPYFEPYNPNLKELKSVFNELIELISSKIKEQTRSLERLNSSLEDRVYQQTLELENQIKDITIARDKAIQAEVAKDEFLANMSHEIRTPLNAILGFVTILKKRTTEDKALHYLNIIDTSGKSLLTIINDILDFSKIQSGKFTISPFEINPVEEFSNATLLFASKAYEKHLIYAVYIDPNLPQAIKVDAVRVKQILSNLLSNAIKFTPEDGTIKISITIKESQLNISVEDSGIGIAKENISKVFSAFEQADGTTTRKYGGTGLGLSISTKLASLMNGKLTLKSELGVGSVFSLSLAIEIINAAPQELIKKDKMASYTFGILNNCADCTAQTKLIKKYLQDFGAINIIELSQYSDESYDILFFVPDDDYNEDIVNSDKRAIAMLRSNTLKLANLTHIQALYAPFTPKTIIQAINDSNIQDLNLISNNTSTIADEDEVQYSGSILIAEDNKTNQMLISLMMDDYGINYTIANNGLEAVDKFKERKYDMVLMDENMPELNGIGAMKQIKEYEKEKALILTPIIALTASVLDTDKEMFLNAGMDGFVGKPINISELESELNKYLKRV